MRVLLVEDEPDLGAAIKRTLTQQKYLVDWVLNGNEAWLYLENSWTQYIIAKSTPYASCSRFIISGASRSSTDDNTKRNLLFR